MSQDQSAALRHFIVEVVEEEDPAGDLEGDSITIGLVASDEESALSGALEFARGMYALNPTLMMPPLFAHIRAASAAIAGERPNARGEVFQVQAYFGASFCR